MEKPRSFSHLLAEVCRQNDINKAQLARLLGVSRQYVGALIAGQVAVGLKVAAKYARALGLPEETFLNAALQDQLRRAGITDGEQYKVTRRQEA